MQTEQMATAQPSERTKLPQEVQSHNDARVLLLLQDYVDHCRIPSGHWKQLVPLLQTKLVAGIVSEQDLRALRTACGCLTSLRIRVKARANVTEREVACRQLQLMQASVQPHLTEDLKLPFQNLCRTFRRQHWSLSNELSARKPVQMRLN